MANGKPIVINVGDGERSRIYHCDYPGGKYPEQQVAAVYPDMSQTMRDWGNFFGQTQGDSHRTQTSDTDASPSLFEKSRSLRQSEFKIAKRLGATQTQSQYFSLKTPKSDGRDYM